MISDWFFRIPPIRVAEARAASGASDTWMYRFDHPDPQDNHGFGACHAAEIPFVFDTARRPELRPLIGTASARGGRVFENRNNGVASGGWALPENSYGTPGT